MKLRKELLIDLLTKDNPSGDEKVIIPMVVTELTSLGFQVRIDEIGNLFAVRGNALKYPLLNAHLDQVDYSDNWLYSYYSKENKYKTNKELVYDYDYEMEVYDEIAEYIGYATPEELNIFFDCHDCYHCTKGCPRSGNNLCCEEFDPRYTVVLDKGRQLTDFWGIEIKADSKRAEDNDTELTVDKDFKVYETKGLLKGTGGRVLGGDDKCGIFIALEVARLLRKMPMKILFTVSEEIGCVGIKHAVEHSLDWFKDVAYSLTIDRREGDNLLWSQCGKRSCSNEFASRMALAGVQCGIPVKLQDGSVADVIYIREIVKESVNMSAGYYDPHTEDEYVNLEDVTRIVKWVRLFLQQERERVEMNE